MGEIYSIGSGGLKKLKTGLIYLAPKSTYYIGASTRPDHIFVSSVDDTWIEFYRYPYSKLQVIERAIGEDLIAQGSQTHLSQYRNFNEKPQWMKDELDTLEMNLRNEPGPMNGKVDINDLRPVDVRVEESGLFETGKNSLWNAAEEYGGVTGDNSNNTLIIHTNGEGLNKLRDDSRFNILSIDGEDVKKESVVVESAPAEVSKRQEYTNEDFRELYRDLLSQAKSLNDEVVFSVVKTDDDGLEEEEDVAFRFIGSVFGGKSAVNSYFDIDYMLLNYVTDDDVEDPIYSISVQENDDPDGGSNIHFFVYRKIDGKEIAHFMGNMEQVQTDLLYLLSPDGLAHYDSSEPLFAVEESRKGRMGNKQSIGRRGPAVSESITEKVIRAQDVREALFGDLGITFGMK